MLRRSNGLRRCKCVGGPEFRAAGTLVNPVPRRSNVSRDAQILTIGLALFVAGAIVFSTCWMAPLRHTDAFIYRCGACHSRNTKERIASTISPLLERGL